MAVASRGIPLLDRLRGLAVPAIVFALPFEFTGGYLPFKFDVARVLMLVALALLALDLAVKRRAPVLPRTATALWLGVFVVEAAMSWSLTRAPGSLSALAPVVAYPVLAVLVLNLVRTEAEHRAVLIALLASGIVVSVIGLASRATGTYLINPDVSTLGRVNATFSDPDILARFLALVAAAGVLVAGERYMGRWRALGLAAALLAAAVIPETFSRIGFVLIVIVVGIGLWLVRPRQVASAAVIAMLLVSGVSVAIQPQVRDRVGNLAMLMGELIVPPPPVPPITMPSQEGQAVASVKACAVPTGWEVVPDPKAQYGQTAELQRGADAGPPVEFGPTLVLPAGRYHVWEHIRVDSASSSAGQLRQGVWDPELEAYITGLFQDNAPIGFSRSYRWILFGTLDVHLTRTVQFRAEAFAPTTTNWYIDRFVLSSVDRVPLRPDASWGDDAALLSGPPASTAGFAPEDDRDASGGVAAVLPQGSPPGSSTAFVFPAVPSAGQYQLWGLMRVGSPLGSQPELRTGISDAARGDPIAGASASLAPSDGCASYTWRQLGTVTLPARAMVQATVSSVAPTTTEWHVDRFALAPVPPQLLPAAPYAAAGGAPPGMRLVAAYEPTRSPFLGLVNRLPLDDERRYLIVGGLDMWRDHPLTGVGFGGFQHSLVGPYSYDIKPPYHDTLSHNSFVTVLAEQGLIGFVILIAILVAVVLEVRRGFGGRLKLYVAVPAVLLGLVVFDSLFEGRLFTEPYLWVLLGLLSSAAGLQANDRSTGDRLSVLVLTHYYPPEVGAPQARLQELAQRLATRDVDVTVVTCFPNYPRLKVNGGDRHRLLREERVGGIRVIRTWVFASGNRGFVRRVANQASFSLSSLLALGRCGRPDVVFVESPPLTMGLAGLAYSWLKRAPFVFNVSDIWPQSAVDLGALRNPAAIRLAEAFEMHVYRRAAVVSVVTGGILDLLAGRGVPRDKLRLLTNGVDTSTYTPGPPDADLVRELGLEGRKVILYAGTHGMAQGLEVVLDAAGLVRDPSVLFLLVGDGVEKADLEARAAARELDNVRFLPSQPRDAMPRILNLAMAALIPLRRLDLFRSALPSKMFEAMAAGRPIVLAVWGEAADLVEKAGCGIAVEPEDPAAIAAAVDRLAGDPELAAKLGGNGRRLALERFDREMLVDRCLDVLRHAAGREART